MSGQRRKIWSIQQTWQTAAGLVNLVDDSFSNSKAGKYFAVKKRQTKLSREIYAGTVTFLTMSYILAVNASILLESGGPCTVNDCTGPNAGTNDCKRPGLDPGFQLCLDETRASLITATCASSLISCFIMGAFANMPVALAPGLGLNAYFAYNVVGYLGSGNVSYGAALTAVFIEGWVFLLLSVTGARAKLITWVPRSIALAMSAGIGMFLAFIGLQYQEGIGAVTADPSTLVTLGGCPSSYWVPMYESSNLEQACTTRASDGSFTLLTPSSNHVCAGHKLESARLWLGLAGLTVMCVLMHRGWRGSIITGVLFVTFISWIPGHGASYLGEASNFPGGVGNNGAERLKYFKKVVAAPSLSRTGWAFDWNGLKEGNTWLALITFLYVDFFDCTGTLFSMANFLNGFIPGFVDRKRRFPNSTWAFSSDGIGIIVGSAMGTSPVTAYIDSATGIREGARTGLAALTCTVLFFIALFFNPLFASIPPYATGPALILVGSLMMINVVKIKWGNVNEAVPAFLTMILMPLTFSIAYGVVGGLVAYIISNSINWTLDRLGDLWVDWRQGKAGLPKERYAKSDFGHGADPAGGGTSIGNRRSLERTSMTGEAKLYHSRTFNLHRGDTDSSAYDGPRGGSNGDEDPQDPSPKDSHGDISQKPSIDDSAHEDLHLENGSKHGNGSGATPKKPAKGVSFAEHLVLTGDSLNSHGSIPEEGPGHEEVPPGDPSSAGVPLHQGGEQCLGGEVELAPRLSSTGSFRAASPGPSLSRQGSLKKPLDEGMYAQGGYREASPSASPGGSLRGGQAFGPPLESPRRSARSATKDTEEPAQAPALQSSPKGPAPSSPPSRDVPRGAGPREGPALSKSFSMGPDKRRKGPVLTHSMSAQHSHPPRIPPKPSRPAGQLDRASTPGPSLSYSEDSPAQLWAPSSVGEAPFSPFSDEGRKRLHTSLSGQQLAELLRSQHGQDDLKVRGSISESFEELWGVDGNPDDGR